VVTTGTTIQEATQILKKAGVEVNFILVLVDKRW
jgi:orotate phosphoribosyltransferase